MTTEEKDMDKGTPTKKKKTVKKKKAVSKSKVPVSARKFEDLDGKLLHVKVGTTYEPATDKQIEDIETKIVSLLERNDVNCLAFVTHHAVDMRIVDNSKQEGQSNDESVSSV